MTSNNHGTGSSFVPDSKYIYDVFLSFKGETRHGFTAHLHEKLLDQGINKVFLDELELQRGKPVENLFPAIEQSRFAIIVISQNYASSTWCLRELSKILECMEARGQEEVGGVLPVFYSVEPSHVGYQLGTFEQAFTKLEQRFLDDMEKVVQWRADLSKVAKIKGWTSKDRSEPDLIKEIVEEIRDQLRPVLFEPKKDLVGIDSQLEQLDLLLDTGSNEVRLVGICGLGGIGKSTLADTAYRRILTKFEASSFLDRVGQEYTREGVDGLANLKIKLSRNLMNVDIIDWNVHEEHRLKHFLRRKKVLLILDNVDHINQLEELCGDPDWFHLGSRIIITTRKEDLLIAHNVKETLKMQGLSEVDALQLFSWRAFKRDYPPDDYFQLSKEFVDYASGLPLALKVLGSLLYKKNQVAWCGELGKLSKENLKGEIEDILKISYDGLDEPQKNIFLDIACFFNGMYRSRVVEILAGCGFDPDIEIDILIKRSLVTISDGIVWMHDLLQKMGQLIVCQESQEAGERSRLWLTMDISHVLKNNTGTNKVVAISLDVPEGKKTQCHPKAFSKMFNLKYLKLHGVYPSKNLKCLPQLLRFFEWSGYSSKKLPPDFEPDELVELNMCHSSIEQLWVDVTKNLDRLKVMKLSHSKSLARTPDFIKIQNLERLDLEGCESLVTIDQSIGVLKKLKFLNLKGCRCLVTLPHKIEMVILETLILSGCSSVRRIPEFGVCMNLLSKLFLDGTAIESIPSSIENLSSLSLLDLRDCSELAELPHNLEKLVHLEKLDLSGTGIREWPSYVRFPESLKSLIFPGRAGPKGNSEHQLHMALPKISLSGLFYLRELDLSNHNSLEVDFGYLPSLVSLNLSGNNFSSLPGSIRELSQLENIYLSGCNKLKLLPVLSSQKNLEVIADGCSSLKEIQYPSNLGRLKWSCFNFINCFGLLRIESYSYIIFTMLQRYLKGVPYPGDTFEIVIPGSEIPGSFSLQRVGSSVSVDLTPDWHDNEWMGYALCAVFEVFGNGWELSCVLEVNGKEQYPAPLLSTKVQPVSDHLWLIYVSRDISFGTGWQNSCNQLVFSFRNSGPIMVKKCGVHLVYKQDLEEYNMNRHQQTLKTPSISASSFEPTAVPRYDVFISFRGIDTRKNFVDHLYRALRQKGILTYRDEEKLVRGESFGPNLLQAIKESRYIIVVFSQNYADSSWCLDEIVTVVQCMKAMGTKVLPVYYHVDPSDVRRQTGHFVKAFEKHQKRFKDKPDRVNKWKIALSEVGNLSGWHLQDGDESQVIQAVIETIFTSLNRMISVPDGLVGMDYHVQKMLSCLDIGCPDVRIIGICGMGGIGKTTIAQVVFEMVQAQFEEHSFLENVSEVTKKQGAVHLQQQLLSNLLKSNVHVQTSDMRKDIIRHRIWTKRVLVVLDDVDQEEQLEELCNRNWFGPGSRIILTSRDEHVLSAFGVDEVYKVNPLTDDEAFQLFALKAFKEDQLVGEDFLELSKEFLKYANGLPLAIKVLASSVRGRSVQVWFSALGRLKNKSTGGIIDVLKVSYDGLEETEKKIFLDFVNVLKVTIDGLKETEKRIFLDIACFFKGEDRDRVIRILSEGEGSCAEIDIEVLVRKSLVTVVGRKLVMENLIQQLGQEIVVQESREEPGKRSRLWDSELIIHVLQTNQGSSALQGIALDFPKTEEVQCSTVAFSKMYRLRILQIRNVHMKEAPRYLSDELMCLEWSGYPTESLPQNFNPGRLRELNLSHSRIERLWTGKKDLPSLTEINLSYSQKLTRTPDFTYAPRLERLILVCCTSLVYMHPSIAFLKWLTYLNLKDCRSIESLPSKIELNCLRILILSGCSKLKKIPDFVGSTECLLELWLDETSIEQLPISVGLLTGLILLNLRDCKNLKSFPSDIGNLMSLKRLIIRGCSKLETLPDSLGKIDCLEELDAGGTSISALPSSISLLDSLKILSLRGCKGVPGKMGYPLIFQLPITDLGGLRSLTELNLSDCNLQEGTVPKDLGCLSSLLSLDVSKNSFVSLPKSFRQLSKLQNLNLESCKSLQNLPNFSSRIDCSVGEEGGNSERRMSSCFNLINCFKLVFNQRCTNVAFAMLGRFLQGTSYAGNSFEAIIPGGEISELFSDHGVGSVVSMELPRQQHKNKWMGYAFCASFVIHRDLPVSANRLGKWKFSNHSTAHGLRCEVNSLADWSPSFACSQELGQIESEHLWIFFVPGDYFGTAWQETFHNIEFTFKPSGTGMEVKKCGGRLIYEQDIDLIGKKR